MHMKDFLQKKAWPVFAGLVAASVVMMAFEYANSFMYPLPESLMPGDTAALQAFTASLPWTAYILVFLGWVVGAFAAGWLTTRLSKERSYRLAFATGVILTIAGILNNVVIGHDMFFNIVGLPMFIVFTYVGSWYTRRAAAASVV